MNSDRVRSLTPLLLFAAAGLLTAFAWPMFRGRVYLEHDVGAVFLPLRWFYAECLKSGDSFLWIPNIFGGFYLQGEGQNGMTHPLHLILYRFLPFTYAFDLEFILSYPFMFAGMLLFLRRWKLPSSAIIFGALLFTFSGYAMSSWLWTVHIATLAHLPWLLWCIDIVMRDATTPKTRALAVFGIIAFTASALLVSYPQLVYIMGLVEGTYALFLFRISTRRSMLAVLLGAKLLGVMCAGIQLLPMVDLVRESTRVESSADFRLDQSLHPLNFLSLINPYLFHQRMYEGNGYQGLYGGAVSTALVVWLLARWRTLSVPRWLVVCFGLTALLGAVLTMGRYAYLYTVVSQLPIIELFRGPPRHGAMFHAGWVMLATLGFVELLSIPAQSPRAKRSLLPVLVLPVLSVTLVVLIVAMRVADSLPPALERIEGYVAPTANPAFGAAVMIAAAGSVALAARGWRDGVLAVAVVAIADLSWYHLRHRTTGPLDAFIAGIDTPPAPPDFKIEPNWLPVYDVNGPLMKGYSMATGLVSLTPQRRLDYKVDPVTLQLCGVKWMRSRIGTNDELNAWAKRGVDWIELPNPMPRARLVTETHVSADMRRDIHTTDYARVALVDEPLALAGGEPGSAHVVRDRPGRIAVDYAAPTAQLLVLTEAFHAGWRVTVNGEPRTPVRVYGDWLGVVVEPGDGRAEFTFAPASWRWGIWITIAGCVLSVVYCAGVALAYRRFAKGE